MTRTSSLALAGVLCAAAIVGGGLYMRPQARTPDPAADTGAVAVKRTDFVRSVRLAGTVEAVQATAISAPRLAGQNNNSLVIMRLIKAGTPVKAGDPLVEFDRQEQIR